MQSGVSFMPRAKRLVLLLSLLMGAWISTAESVGACSCVSPPPVQIARDQSSAVFAGTVVNIGLIGPMWQPDSVQVTFRVAQVWKGVAGNELNVTTASSSANCGFEFSAGGEYLVYAGGDQDHPTVSLCSRTRWLVQADEDMRVLGVGRVPWSVSGSGTGNDGFGLIAPILVLAVGAGFAVGVGLTFLVMRKRED